MRGGYWVARLKRAMTAENEGEVDCSESWYNIADRIIEAPMTRIMIRP
jgi:hypothetical protein